MNLPSEIVDIRDGIPMVSSLQVAEKFNKQHAHVLRAIQNLEMSEEFRQSNFGLANYDDAQGKPRPMYWMTRDGFWSLAMTFTGKEAAKLREGIINALNKAEQILKSGALDVPAMLRRFAEEYEHITAAMQSEREQRLSITKERTQDFNRIRELERMLADFSAALDRITRHSYKEFKELEDRRHSINDMFSKSDAENVTKLPVAKDWQRPL